MELIELWELINGISGVVNFIKDLFNGTGDTYDEEGNLLESGTNGIAGLLESANDNTDEIEPYLEKVVEYLYDTDSKESVIDKFDKTEKYIGEYIESSDTKFDELSDKIDVLASDMHNINLISQYMLGILFAFIAFRFCHYLFAKVFFGNL